MDWTDVRDRMRRPWVFDGRNICDPEKMTSLGFLYRGIGRPRAERVAANYRVAEQGVAIAALNAAATTVAPPITARG